MFVNNQEDLDAFAERARFSRILAIDTEFLREKTYYAKLCLLQMATDDEVVIVDPFAVDDLKVLSDVLVDPNVTKLFHAGSQDVEILYRECGVVPRPIFDTQVAAAVLGHTQQVGYGPLVSSMCGVTLKKSDSYTDWSKRPLSRSQMEYAADDVIYLPRVYDKMTEQLNQLGRMSWLDADFRAMEDPSRYEEDPRERYRRLKRVTQLKRAQLCAAQEAAAWREEYARRFDIPRKWVLTDEQIVEACKRGAMTIDELFMVRGVSERLSIDEAREVVACLKKGFGAPQETWPSFDAPGKSEINVDAIVDAMSAIVRMRARENNIAYQTLVGHGDLSRVARGYDDVPVLQGWRRDIVGKDLLAFLSGKITLTVSNGNLSMKTKARRTHVATHRDVQ